MSAYNSNEITELNTTFFKNILFEIEMKIHILS